MSDEQQERSDQARDVEVVAFARSEACRDVVADLEAALAEVTARATRYRVALEELRAWAQRPEWGTQAAIAHVHGYQIDADLSAHGQRVLSLVDAALAEAGTPAGEHPEARCRRCGRPNVVWFAPNDLWNRIEGGPDGVLCPVCFVQDAERAGIDAVWRLAPAGGRRRWIEAGTPAGEGR